MSKPQERRGLVMTTYAMSARQRLVGWCLRAHREDAGYCIDDAARILACDPSKVSRIETGRHGIRAAELRVLLGKYGAEPAVLEALAALARPRRGGAGWWTEHASVLPDPYLELISAETAASAVSAYAPVQVPELLQAPAYASAAAAADASVPQGFEAAFVAAALDRQRVALYERVTPLDVVIGEAALRQRAGGAAVMRDQLSHLAETAGRCPHAIIRLLPFTVGMPPAGGAGGFCVLRFGKVPALSLVHVAGPSGGLFPDAPQAAIGYLRAFSHLQALALGPEATTRRLRELARGQ
jgi:Domain of unknown function (DUF5753)/Helix-turn-helix domain